MAVSHLDRLSATDASFLSRRTRRRTCTSARCCVFEGPPPSYDEFLEHVEARLHLVPRYRQKLAFPPLQAGRPFWVDDPRLNLEYHVRHSSLPAPGDDEPAGAADGAPLLPAARPLQAAVGDVAGPGPRGQPLRADQQDAPRARRRRLRRRPRDGAVRREPGARRADAARCGPGSRTPSPATPSWWRAASQGLAKLPLGHRQARARRRCGIRATRRTALAETARGRRRGRVGADEPGAQAAAQHATSGRTAATAGCTPTCPTSRSIKDAFGGTVNDVVLAVVAGGAADAGCAPAACAPRASRLRALVPGQPAHRRGAGHDGQPAGRLPRAAAGVSPRTRSSGCGSCARRCRRSSSPSR